MTCIARRVQLGYSVCRTGYITGDSSDRKGARVKILVVLHGHPLDKRIEKELRSLHEAGHEMHVLTSVSPGEPRDEVGDVFQIHRWIPKPWSSGPGMSMITLRISCSLPATRSCASVWAKTVVELSRPSTTGRGVRPGGW